MDYVNKLEINKKTDQEQFNSVLLFAKKYIDEPEWRIFEASISIRKYAPLVRIHYQLGQKYKQTCESFFVYNQKSECDIQNIKPIISSSQTTEEVYPFDHIFPSENHNFSNTLFIYGVLGSEILQKSISEAVLFMKNHPDNKIRIVFRHCQNKRRVSTMSLAGYAVELALKNTEYKAHESHGSEQKIDKIEEEKNLEPSEIKLLSRQTCQHIIKVHETTPSQTIEQIKYISQNFPKMARNISKIKLDENSIMEIDFHKFRRAYKKPFGIDNGQNLLSLNGRVISTSDGEHIDVFELMNTLKEEMNVIQNIEHLGIKSNIDILSYVDFSKKSLRVAFDYRVAEPLFLNNYEEENGPKDLRYLFNGATSSDLARNIFTVIVFVNPFEKKNSILEELFEIQNTDRIRIGLVYVYPLKDGESLENLDIHKSNYQNIQRLSQEAFMNHVEKGNRFLEVTGLSESAILLNGYPIVINSSGFKSVLQTKMAEQINQLKKQLYFGVINLNVDVMDYWISTKYNHDIVERTHIKIIESIHNNDYLKTKEFESVRKYISALKKFRGKNTYDQINLNVNTIVIGDFTIEQGRKTAINALLAAEQNENEQVILISNSLNEQVNHQYLFLKDDKIEAIEMLKTGKVPKRKNNNNDNEIIDNIMKWLETIGISKGQTFIISNGLIVGPIEERNILIQEDFEFLNKMWETRGVKKVSDEIEQNSETEDVMLPCLLILAESSKHDRHSDMKQYISESNMIIVEKEDKMKPSILLTWFLDPSTRESQQLTSIVEFIHQIVNIEIQIILNPYNELEDMPIDRFYRFAISNKLEFDENGNIKQHNTVFEHLPETKLLTMDVHTNEAWMIEIKQAKYDLDNILLEQVDDDVEAVYTLENILIEGSCSYENEIPASGIELIAEEETKMNPIKSETIVMHNLGYFQLKAEPGVWTISIRNNEEKEKYTTIKKIDDHSNIENQKIIIDSFSSKWSNIYVESNVKDNNWFGSFKNAVKNVNNYFEDVSNEENNVINVFSVASGHLYERFLKIMMVSVMKQSKESKVKFWLLKNYLSPEFKNKIEKMSKAYKFEYELVEYKWPKWLTRQKIKQRIMWGYKILFLDVIFPLKLNKIIFVDADQVVRTDLKELMDLPLDEAVYGYVPFCDSRQEMEGYRFWKSGYWENSLNGRKYHISALYVVDLKKFREISAGDRLRGQYYMLSRDPNSLSNLDQDLPNNMMSIVPLKTLPQEWLWCETWCDDESKKTAKTIDLCNNPLTKEPKLDAARRIILEWNDYDKEIELLLKTTNQKEKKKYSSSEEL